MFHKRRQLKKHRTKQRIIAFVLIGIAGLLVAVGIVAYLVYRDSQKPLFVSPLSHQKPLNVATETERNISLAKTLLTEKKITYLSIEAAGEMIIISLPKDREVILSQGKDIAEQISSLQYILSRLTMEGKLFSRLDLRFEKPVVVLQK